MTHRGRLTIELSEKRERINALLGMPTAELTDELRAEMATVTTRLQAIEPELRAAIVAEENDPRLRGAQANGDGEHAEIRRVLNSSNMGRIITCSLEHRATEGAEDELQKHYKLAPNQIPLAMLARRPAEELDTLARVETRGVTEAPSNTQRIEHEVVPYVFPGTARRLS